MNIQRATSFNELLARIFFLILPTAVAIYFVVHTAFGYYSVIGDYQSLIAQALPYYFDQAMLATFYCAAGMVGAAVFYAFRFRFLPSALLLYLLLYTLYKGIDSISYGEFDSIRATVQFLVFAVFFGLGWLMGWGYLRLRYMSILVAALIMIPSFYLVSKTMDSNMEVTAMFRRLMLQFSPAILFSVYLIFTAEQIYSYKDKSQKFWWFLARRVSLFSLLIILLYAGVVYWKRVEIKEVLKAYGGGGKAGQNSMLQQKQDGSFDLSQYSKLSSSLGRSNDLLFCAHIDNYFGNSKAPNPLYLTNKYYTSFDTLTETFSPDTTLPYNDLFLPNPAQMPLFSTRTDSSVIRNGLGNKLRKTVDLEIYTTKLSPSVYLAPNTGYFVQPITIEKDFKEAFKSAYRAKAYVSELNSAYFVYNAKDTQIKMFQAMRFAELRKVKGYEGVDPKFMKYYTYMPSAQKFQRISELSRKITAQASLPVDKVIALRDYFLSKDENGDPLFSYTDNPGIPDLPSASKLMYFLFDNHKGYCAYYAGATLFMLRSLGIPSRIAVGFLTVDRSDKNPGWYWYYADQAHAWVQVYFPEYGWLDFDTTVGNDDARESPQADQTPPMQPPRAWLAATGEVLTVDTSKKLLHMKVRQMVFHDKEYPVSPEADIEMDVHIAAVRRDSIDVPLSSVKKGDEATAVSYAEVLKKMSEVGGEAGTKLAQRIAQPAPIDEVYIKSKPEAQKEEKPKKEQPAKPVNYRLIGLFVGLFTGLLAFLFFMLPNMLLAYYQLRYRNADPAKGKAYWAYRAATFYLHQLGIFRNQLTPMQYATKVVDPALGTGFAAFMNIYLKQKYARQYLNTREQEAVSAFLQPFLATVKQKIPFGKRIGAMLNPFRTLGFFFNRDDEQ